MKKTALVAFVLAFALMGCAVKRHNPAAQIPIELAKYPGVEQTTTIEGIRIVFLDEGKGDPILFIHGLSGDISDWNDQITYFKQNYRVLALDLPGHGKSEKRNDIPYGRALFTKVVSEFLKQRGVDKAIVVGNSMGGMIAASMALDHPEQVRMLVLSDAAGVNPFAFYKRWGMRRISPEMTYKVWANPKTIRKTAGAAYAHPQNYPQSRIGNDLALVQAPDSKEYAYAIIVSLRDTVAQDFRPRLKQITCPTMIIWGAMDTTIADYNADIWHEGIPGSVLVRIPDAGHIPMDETPDAFNKAVEILIHGYGDDRILRK